MPEYEFVTVDVFTDRRFGGNPLAVFPDARGLSDARMQAIAAEFNLSETTFVLPPEDARHDARVRIFTPRSELPFAGHPNVGTGFVLARRAASTPDRLTFEEGAGPVRVDVLRHMNGVSGARIAAPIPLTISADIPADVVAGCVGLDPSEIVTAVHGPLVASVGAAFVIAEVMSVDALARAAPDLGALRAARARFGSGPLDFALHLYARRGGDAARLRSRMFAPLDGIPEDPATGSANAALAALLTSLRPEVDTDQSYEIEQGIEMGRPSRIIAAARKDAKGAVTASVAGDCVPVMRGWLDL